MNELLELIKQKAADLSGKTVETRRHLHAHPELSFKEYETASYIARRLREIGLEPEEKVAGTGVVALISGKLPGNRVIALRADTDALPILEANKVPYASKNPGVMHACGHDVHTASLLATAEILNSLRDRFPGTVKLIFQPAEEKAPGGARKMIEAGVLKDPEPDAILGQHVMVQIPVGKVGFKPGLYMASADEIYFTVKGKGGHGAMPDKNIDPVLITSHIIVALQQIVSRNANPLMPSVLSFGRIIADGATNVIPNEVQVAGTFRTLDEKWRMEALERIRRMAGQIAEAMGGSCEFHIVKGYPSLYNEEKLTKKSRAWAAEYMGEENIIDLDVWMAAEDFAYYSRELDACFYRIGVSNEAKGIVSNVHTPTFDIDEQALETGPGLMTWLCINNLNS